MSRRTWWRAGGIGVVCTCAALAAHPASAQPAPPPAAAAIAGQPPPAPKRPAPKPPAPPEPQAAVPKAPPGGEAEVDPINCWWRTDKSAVAVGERMTLTLTCGIVDADRNKVNVDPNQLDPAALSLSPFEIVSGTRHEDVLSPPWRYFQYEYTVRVIGPAFFGLDIDIPSVTLKYTIVSNIGGNEGREQMYVLPALPVRVMSLVPAKAADIRDATHDSFADLEARRRRATEEMIGAALAFGFAVVLIGLALAQLFRRYRKRVPAESRLLPPRTLIGASLRALRNVKRDVARDGWTRERAGQALAALRIAAATALGQPVAQMRAGDDAVLREGQVRLGVGPLGRRQMLISAAASPGLIERLLAIPSRRRSARVAAAAEELRESLRVFSAARYGRTDELDTTKLDEALDSGMAAARRIRMVSALQPGAKRALAKAAAAAVAVVWLR